MKNENKTSKSRNMRRLRFGTASTILTVVVIAGIFLLNVIVDIVANRYPILWDLSANKTFTLSEKSEEIANKVEKELEIIVFNDEDEFTNPANNTINQMFVSYYGVSIPEFETMYAEFYSALQQYRSLTKNKVTYQFINKDQEPEKAKLYEEYDVDEGDILFLSGERYKTSSIYDMYTLDTSTMSTYGYYTFQSTVEKTLASYIYNMQSESDHIVQVLTGHDEDAYTIAGLKTLYELNGYTFRELNITTSAQFDEKAEVMLIAAPEKDYTDAEIKRVQEWLFNDGSYGRHLIVYVHPTADCPNLYELLDVEYGIQVTDELIKESEYANVRDFNLFAPLCDIPSTKYTSNSVSTAKLYTPMARRLTTTLDSSVEEENAISHLGIPLNNYLETTRLLSLKDYNENNAEGAYAPADSEYPLTSMIASVFDTYNNNTQEAAYGTVVVSGCSSMAYSTYVQDSSLNNEELLLDAINSVTGYENSVTISNKTIKTDTVTFTTNEQLIIGLYIFTIGVPIIVLVIGVVVFLRRKNL
ncbi:MAG: Gldg family protein [Clostridia bacterium]|nr:Gldg family protein [Clostridia bacterium]